jgi:hypothetical protein
MKATRALAVAGLAALSPMGCLCAAPTPAPDGLEDLSRFIWDRIEIKEDTDVAVQNEELHDAIGKLNALFAGELGVTDETPLMNVLDDIEAKHVENLEGVAPRIDQLPLAQGTVVGNHIGCSIEQTSNIVLSEKSAEIHVDSYAAYSKTFNEDPEAFAAGDIDQITWSLDYAIDQSPVVYSATTHGLARRVPDLGDERSPFGELFMTRVHLPEPGTFEDEANEFTLDFQLETYHQNDAGDVVHLYTTWRRMKIGPVDSQSDFFINQQLEGSVDWDKETDVACAEGKADTRD